MSDLGELVGSFVPEKAGNGIFGNHVLNVKVYRGGIVFERKKGVEQYPFTIIEKVIAGNYASPTPTYIYMKIQVKGPQKAIEFSLHPNRKDVNLLLGVFCDHLLGPEFPANIRKLSLDLGGLGTPLLLQKGFFLFGQYRLPIDTLQDFTTNQNGFYDLKLMGFKNKLAVSPDYAPNILATIKVLSVIAELNKGTLS